MKDKDRELAGLRAKVEYLEAGVEAGNRAAQTCKEVTQVLLDVEKVLNACNAPVDISIPRRVKLLATLLEKETTQLYAASRRAEKAESTAKTLVAGIFIALEMADERWEEWGDRAVGVKEMLEALLK